MEDTNEKPVQTEKARDFDFREIKPDKPRQNYYLLAFGILTVLIVITGSFFFFTSKPKTSSTEASKSTTKQATQSAKKKLEKCTNNESLSNVKQGYETCYPKGWLQKELKASGLNIGLDPKQVDDSFPGTINIQITDKSEAQTTQEISDNTSKFEFGPIKIDGIKGTSLTYTRVSSDPLIKTPKAITSIVTNFNRTYIVTLNSSAADFEANKVIYENLLTNFKFIANTKNPPWADSRNVLVSTPWFGDSIQSPVIISGEATAFEGTVSLRIKDGKGHVLAQTTTQTAVGFERSPFKASVEFTKPTTKNGTVEVYLVSAKDGGDQDLVKIPVVFP